MASKGESERQEQRADRWRERATENERAFVELVKLLAPDVEVTEFDGYFRPLYSSESIPTYAPRKVQEILQDVRAKVEREKFAAMKQPEKLDYLLEKTLEK